MALKIELRQRTERKPWYCGVYVGGKPLLDATGNVVTVAKSEVYAIANGMPHWVNDMAIAMGKNGAKDITPLAL